MLLKKEKRNLSFTSEDDTDNSGNDNFTNLTSMISIMITMLILKKMQYSEKIRKVYCVVIVKCDKKA